MNLAHFKAYSRQDILSLVKLRRFETKLGERVPVLNDPNEVAESHWKFAFKICCIWNS